jgi:AcrR family transcriptional regulator
VTSSETTSELTSAGAAQPGLRERSKVKRRATIQRTAMRLFAEKGYDSTSVAEIAAAAEVAPRTVSGYFPSKLDLAVSYGDELATRLTAAFAANPDAGLLEVFDRWLAAEAKTQDAETAALAHAMYRANPGLGALTRAHLGEAFRVGGAAIVAHLERPLDDPMLAIGSRAFGAAIETYVLDVLPRTGYSPELHTAVISFLRKILDTAKSS